MVQDIKNLELELKHKDDINKSLKGELQMFTD